jgi:hypothetical protein
MWKHQNKEYCYGDRLAPGEIKHRFSPPPERANFSSTEEYEEASGYWSGRAGRNIALALQQHKQSKPPE